MMNKKAEEGGFKNMIFAFILMSLFGMLILTAVVSMANSYGKDTTQITGGALSLNKFNDSISNLEADSKNLQERFNQKSVWSQVAGISLIGIFPIAKDMFSMILAPFNILSNIMSDILGIPAFVTSIILGLVILGAIFGLWQLLKVGN